VVKQNDQAWQPAHYGPDPDSDFFDEDITITKRYISSFYSAILLLTANDLGPVGRIQTFTVVLGILCGAIYNANIFGNMALLISDMNK
jgi:hypothetical protein